MKIKFVVFLLVLLGSTKLEAQIPLDMLQDAPSSEHIIQMAPDSIGGAWIHIDSLSLKIDSFYRANDSIYLVANGRTWSVLEQRVVSGQESAGEIILTMADNQEVYITVGSFFVEYDSTLNNQFNFSDDLTNTINLPWDDYKTKTYQVGDSLYIAQPTSTRSSQGYTGYDTLAYGLGGATDTALIRSIVSDSISVIDTNNVTGLGTFVDNRSSPPLWSESGANIYFDTGNVSIGTSTSSTKLGILGRITQNYPTLAYDNIVLGSSTTGANLTTGNNNIVIGRDAGNIATTGNNNIIIGKGAQQNSNASANIAIGVNALRESTANINTAIGYNSLPANTSGIYNAGISYETLKNNTTGSRNNAIGFRTLFSNTTGSFNTGIGTEALYSNTTESYNTGIGYQALYDNTGHSNTAIGAGAGRNVEGGANNTYIGRRAAYLSTTGSNNVAIGYYSHYTATTGSQNVIIGREAGLQTTTGSNNTLIGYRAGYLNNQSGSVLIGYTTGQNNTRANTLMIDNSTTSNPLVYGEFDNDYLEVNGSMQVVDSLGIGTATPSAHLDVIGEVEISDFTGGTPTGLIGKDATGQLVDATDELVQDAAYTGTLLTPLVYDDAGNTVEIDLQTVSTDAIPEGDEFILTQDPSLNYSNEKVSIQSIWDNAPASTLTEEEVEDFAYNDIVGTDGLTYDDANNNISLAFDGLTSDAIDGEDLIVRHDVSQSRLEESTLDELVTFIRDNVQPGIGRRSSTTNLSVPASGEVAVPFTSTTFGQGSVGFTYTNSLNNASSGTRFFTCNLLLEVDGDDGAEFDVILRPHNSTTINYEVFELVKHGTGNESFNLVTEIELDFNESVRAMVVNRGTGTADIDFINDFSHMTLSEIAIKE